MKHSVKITLILLGMFLVTQLIGLAVLQAYTPEVKQVKDLNGNIINETNYHLPYGTEPPPNNDPRFNLISIIFSLIIAVAILLILMKWRAEFVLRTWFFIIITLAIGITLNAVILKLPFSAYIAFCIALVITYFKVFRRNILLHNFSELLVYPGIAAIFVPLFNVWTVVLLLIAISVYDMYAVWHTGFMQKMAKYQISQLKLFSGFFIPYVSKEQREQMKQMKKENAKSKKVKVNVAILGGGDVVFPIVLSGVVMRQIGLPQAFLVTLGATLALAALFYYSEKGKFYPAMPFISAGCFVALILAYLI